MPPTRAGAPPWPPGPGHRARRGPGRWPRRRPALWRVAAALGAVVLAVLAGVLAGRPVPAGPRGVSPGVAALALTRDLPAGAVPGRDDLRAVHLPPAAVPADAVPASALPADADPTVRGQGQAGEGRAVGPLALAARRGDLLTRRLLGTGWASADALGSYTLPVGDGVEVGPLSPGDRVDVLAASRGQATTVVRTAPVLGLLPGAEGHAAQVVLGVTGTQAEALAAARAAGTLTLVQAPPQPTGG
jgi:Flp pilus assembly protein CpaB